MCRWTLHRDQRALFNFVDIIQTNRSSKRRETRVAWRHWILTLSAAPSSFPSTGSRGATGIRHFAGLQTDVNGSRPTTNLRDFTKPSWSTPASQIDRSSEETKSASFPPSWKKRGCGVSRKFCRYHVLSVFFLRRILLSDASGAREWRGNISNKKKIVEIFLHKKCRTHTLLAVAKKWILLGKNLLSFSCRN